VRVGFCTHVVIFFDAVGFGIKLLWLLPSSALLRLTSLPPVMHPLQYQQSNVLNIASRLQISGCAFRGRSLL
jgi:hypothetical protein